MPQVTLAGFRGVNTDLPPYRLPEGFLAGLVNGWLRFGQMQPRPGFSRLIALPTNFQQFGLFHRAQLALGEVFFLGYYDGTNWRLARFKVGDTAWTDLGTLPGQPTSAVTYKGWVFIATTGGMRKTDGTNLFNWGIAAPTTAPSATAGSAGNLNGTYQWRVTFVRKQGTYIVESNPSPASAPLSLTNQRANLTIPTSPDPQVNARRIYRTGGTRTTWDLVAEINDNTTTTFTDNTADSALVGAPTLSFYHDPPPVATIVVAHRERLFLAGNSSYPTRVFFSTFGEPEYFPPMTPDDPMGGSWFEVGQQDGQPVTAMAPVGTMLAIFKTRSCWLLRGESQADFVLQPFANIGAASHRSVAPYAGLVFLWDGTNLFLYRGESFENLSQMQFQRALLSAPPAALREDLANLLLWGVSSDRVHLFDLALNTYIGYWTKAGMTFFDVQGGEPSSGQVAYLLTSQGLLRLDWSAAQDFDGASVSQTITFPVVRTPAEMLKRVYSLRGEGTFTSGSISVTADSQTWNVGVPSGIVVKGYAPSTLVGQSISVQASLVGTLDQLELDIVPLRKVV